MPARIDFYYHRNSCDTCAKSQSFIEKHNMKVAEQVDARKTRYDADQAIDMLKGASTLIASRGKSVVKLDLKKQKPDRDLLLKHLLGPHGTLRAPLVRKGGTVLVGFNEDAYIEALD